MGNRFSKPVAFNINNPQEKIILDYVKRRNFSKFAKESMLEKIERDQKKVKSKGVQIKLSNQNIDNKL